jgi:hypothetical protein
MKRYKSLKESFDEKKYLEILDKAGKIIHQRFANHPSSKDIENIASTLMFSSHDLFKYVRDRYDSPSRLVAGHFIEDIIEHNNIK